MNGSASELESWRRRLGEWAIPEEILAQARESPWALPPAYFARRADAQIEAREGMALTRAGEALRPRGVVLDVGAGGGAASLPLAPWTSELIAVDGDPAMLAELPRRAAALGLELKTVEGRWPGVASATPAADVVVCSHVLYNVPDLGPFVTELDRHARRRVVIEITARHPAGTLNPLWLRFHDLRRPERPTWEDALGAIRSLGLEPRVEHEHGRRGAPAGGSFEEIVAWTRRRLCLPPEREAEVADALVEMGVDPERAETWRLPQPERVILWWDRR